MTLFRQTEKKHMQYFNDKLNAEYQQLCATIETLSRNKTLGILSARKQTGKSLIALKLATDWAKMGEKVLLVDADFSCSQLNSVLNVQDHISLGELIHNQIKIEQLQQYIQSTSITNLDIITAGKHQHLSSTDINNNSFLKIIASVKQPYDKVVITLPPILSSASIKIAQALDNNILIVNNGQTRSNDIQHLLSLLKLGNVNLLGYVMNNID